ncbi:MAG TPA: ribonuclease Y [bacterium]|jgi:ribonuclease Y|nr:ribonuclease Y [bacterium]HQL11664.1 ribonuclease Y [bacterium]
MNDFLLVVLGLVIGAIVGFFYNKKKTESTLNSATEKAKKLVEEAKARQQSLLLQAQEQSIKIINDAKNEINEEKRMLKVEKEKIEKRESLFDEKLLTLEERQSQISKVEDEIRRKQQELEEIKKQQVERLEKIANLSREQAKEEIIKIAEESAKEDAVKRIKEIQKLGYEDMEKEAKNILMLAMQRFALPVAVDVTTTNVEIPSEEMKGRIIGKEGRNIKIFEQITGVELIIDDTPNIITISCFNPIRRHIAKRALEYLIADGRIQPARIEEFVDRARNELALDIRKAGEEAIAEVGVAGIDPKLISIIGRLKYRTSYGQNVLQHSIEVAIISGLIANEVGADITVAKKGGLLHDIGKAVDYEVQGTHPEIGKNIAQKFNLPESVIIPIATHHDDMPPTLEAVIVKVADQISGARPGSRKDTTENYMQRLEDLEEIATRNEKVQKAYAISAGRELRIFVDSEASDDLEALNLAKKIALDVENELKYPGEIKITMIREKRIIEYAR